MGAELIFASTIDDEHARWQPLRRGYSSDICTAEQRLVSSQTRYNSSQVLESTIPGRAEPLASADHTSDVMHYQYLHIMSRQLLGNSATARSHHNRSIELLIGWLTVKERRMNNLPITYRSKSPKTSLSPRVRTSRPSFVPFFVFSSNDDYLAMNIIDPEGAINPSSLKFKIGGAALVFEETENWKYHFRPLIVRNGT